MWQCVQVPHSMERHSLQATGLSDVIVNVPGACMPWRRVLTLKLIVYACSKSINFRSCVRDTAF
jgi:hypothetical protein